MDQTSTPLPAVPPVSLLRRLGPGLVTGAADDDPSGIATYSQVGAQFGYAMAWTMLFSLPFMIVVQDISARIGAVTGRGIADNLRRHYPASLVRGVVGLLLAANTINLGADLGAMGEAVRLLAGGDGRLYTVAFGVGCVLAEIFITYARYAGLLKWLTLALFAYVAVAFAVHVPWGEALAATLVPHITFDSAHAVALVAVLGTTISPYLFFWQSAMEVEEHRRNGTPPLCLSPAMAGPAFARIRTDTVAGMAISNLVAIFIIVATAATLHATGITDIQTSSQAAEALRPIAGDFTFAVFALGIIGTGLLAVPVLAGSGAYALGEARRWPTGFSRNWQEAKAFYATVAIATLVGMVMNFSGIDAIKALYWSAVLNGVVAVPVMTTMMLMAARSDIMGRFAVGGALKWLGWTATAVMALAVVAMLVTSF